MVAQCFVRLLNAVQPARDPMPAVPVPQAGAIAQPWQVDYHGSSRVSGTDYPCVQCIQQDSKGYRYQVNLPELGWLAGGRVGVISFKAKVFQLTNGFASVMMFVTHARELIGCAGATQVGDDDTLYGVPAMMRQPDQTADALIEAFVATYPDALATTNDPSEIALPVYLEGLMKAVVQDFNASDADILAVARPDLPRLSGKAPFAYDLGNRPAIAVSPMWDVLELHCNDDGMYCDTLLYSSGDLSLRAHHNDYQDGQDPTLALLRDNATVIEVHRGAENNKLYWNAMTLYVGGNVKFLTTSGQHYDNGESPSLATTSVDGVDRIFEVHRDGKATSDQLYYNTATWDGSKLSWNTDGARREYANGQWPSIAFAPGSATLLEAHCSSANDATIDDEEFREYDVYVMEGVTTASSVTFNNTQKVMLGQRPTLGVQSDGTVVLFAVQDGYLAYSIGKLDNGVVSWALGGQRWQPGDEPNLKVQVDFQPNDLVLVYEDSEAYHSEMRSAVLTSTIPAGFFTP